MPRGNRLVTFLTTSVVALLVVAAGGAFPVGTAGGETVQQGTLQVGFGGSVEPQLLPRTGTTPITVDLRGEVNTTDASVPPSLQRIAIEVNRLGQLERRGLPSCPIRRLRAASTEDALRTCAAAKVGEGHAGGLLVLPEQEAIPFNGYVVAFNGRLANGRPAILAHLYTLHPAPFTYVLAFAVSHVHGTFGTRLVASVPANTRATAHITSFSLKLHRVYTVGTERRSYLSAGCPAPSGFPSVSFPLVRAAYSFDGQQTVSDTLVRTCHAGG